MSRQITIHVSDSSHIGEARRLAVRNAELAGFNQTDTGRLAIIATEMATNLVRYASDGKILIQTLEINSGKAVELLSVDSGPGMADVERCLQDGYSTGGTPGNGLGAIKRLSSEFDIYSTPAAGTVPAGTVIVSKVHLEGTPPLQEFFAIGAASIPVHGETACGDAWKSSQSGRVLRLMVADGLGHGPLAEEAANASIRAFDEQSDADPKTILESADRALSGTRGAAVAVALLDADSGQLKYAGIGNIAGSLMTNENRQGLVSNNGIVGNRSPRKQQFEYASTGNGLLIMHSDGIRSRWMLDVYAGLSTRHPAIIAGVLYRDFRRGRDDVTVVVVRFGSARF